MLTGYASYMVEMVREKLGYEPDDNSHDEEVLAYFNRGEKISKSKHLNQEKLGIENRNKDKKDR